jgi:hypothetical protein
MDLELNRAFAEANLVAEPTPSGLCGHDVQFYRSEEFHVRTVTDFLAAGVRAGQPLVVIATAARREAFKQGLRARRLDTDELFSGREATWLDARETLSAFMEGAVPNRELFLATVGSVFERVLRKRNYLIVRGYGEMVDVLASEGELEAAIEVEALWNELAERYSYSLLCGYSVSNFLHERGPSSMTRICEHHTRALRLEEGLGRGQRAD